MEVLQCIGDVLCVALGIFQEVIRDVEVYGVGEGGLGEQFADVGGEALDTGCAGAGGHQHGLFGAPRESWRNVDCCEESGFSDVEGGVAGDGVVETFCVRNDRIEAGWGNVLLLSAEFYCGKKGAVLFLRLLLADQ